LDALSESVILASADNLRPHLTDLYDRHGEYVKAYKKYCMDVRKLEHNLALEANRILEEQKTSINKIPNFWGQALYGHPEIRKAISEKDLPVLEYLQEIQLEMLPYPQLGWTMHFIFRPDNPYFKHPRLSKTYIMDSSPTLNPETVEIKCEPEDISWTNTSVDPTREMVLTTDENGEEGTDFVSKPSFFHWFGALTEAPMEDGLDDLEPDEREMELVLREAWAADLGIAYSIKDEVLPHAVKFFTGEMIVEAESPAEEKEHSEKQELAQLPAT